MKNEWRGDTCIRGVNKPYLSHPFAGAKMFGAEALADLLRISIAVLGDNDARYTAFSLVVKEAFQGARQQVVAITRRHHHRNVTLRWHRRTPADAAILRPFLRRALLPVQALAAVPSKEPITLNQILGNSPTKLLNGLLYFSRDSPDESQTGINVRVFPALLQDRRELLTAINTSERWVEGLIWPFSLAFGRTPSVGCS